MIGHYCRTTFTSWTIDIVLGYVNGQRSLSFFSIYAHNFMLVIFPTVHKPTCPSSLDDPKRSMLILQNQTCHVPCAFRPLVTLQRRLPVKDQVSFHSPRSALSWLLISAYHELDPLTRQRQLAGGFSNAFSAAYCAGTEVVSLASSSSP